MLHAEARAWFPVLSPKCHLCAPRDRCAPSHLAGEGWGGGSQLSRELHQPSTTPTPNPSPQGGGEYTEPVAHFATRTWSSVRIERYAGSRSRSDDALHQVVHLLELGVGLAAIGAGGDYGV